MPLMRRMETAAVQPDAAVHSVPSVTDNSVNKMECLIIWSLFLVRCLLYARYAVRQTGAIRWLCAVRQTGAARKNCEMRLTAVTCLHCEVQPRMRAVRCLTDGPRSHYAVRQTGAGQKSCAVHYLMGAVRLTDAMGKSYAVYLRYMVCGRLTFAQYPMPSDSLPHCDRNPPALLQNLRFSLAPRPFFVQAFSSLPRRQALRVFRGLAGRQQSTRR